MKNKLKIYLDYIPLIILLVSAAILIWVASGEIVLVWKHYVGLIFLAITTVLFFIRHLFGVLSLGFILILGLVGILSYSPGIVSMSFGVGPADNGITLLKFQPVFALWLLIYTIICWRHLIGVLSKKYWIEVKNRER